jgi:glycosyltransferase involved in cell wall biosynthesis
VRRDRPAVLFVQNPSLVLAFTAVHLRRLSAAIVVDAHNAGISPAEGRSRLLTWVARYVIRRADLTIVTNANLAAAVHEMGGRAVVVQDPLPGFGPADAERDSATRESEILRLVFICTWADDEPYSDVIAAANALPDNVVMFVTGRWAKRHMDALKPLPHNVKLTGFLADSDYEALIASADVLVDLTTRENCLVCGAYEAIALSKPLVVSDTVALRRLLGSSAVFTKNDVASIGEALRLALSTKNELAQAASWQRHRMAETFAEQLNELEARLSLFGTPK